MTHHDSPIYRQEVRIGATPDAVFDFLVDADTMVRWIGIAATIDARPGGELRIDINERDIVRGEFVVIDRPERVVFSWGYEGSTDMAPGCSTVEVTLTPDEAGTLLVLTHSDVPAPRLGDHAKGWTHFLDRLLGQASNEPLPQTGGPEPKERP